MLGLSSDIGLVDDLVPEPDGAELGDLRHVLRFFLADGVEGFCCP